jgi:DGQHR domain-containing protein
MKKTRESPVISATAIRVNQHGRDLYLFSLSARHIHELIESGKMDIDRWSPAHPEGYQRVPIDSRYKRYGKFVAKSGGISPTSILLSLRKRDALEIHALQGSECAFNIRVKDFDGKIYIPDGQHRAYGLDWAVKEYPGEIDDYEVPVVLFIGAGKDPIYDEAQQFYLINTNAKRVKTDLAQRYTLRNRETDLGEIVENLQIPGGSSRSLDPYAVKIVDMLNAEGPLKGRIALPNTENPRASISQNSFIDSIRPIVAKASEAHWTVGKTRDIIKAFWAAVKAKCPEAFNHWSGDACVAEDPHHFSAVLVKTAGMYALNEILSRSMLLPGVASAPTSPETFRALLDKREVARYFKDGCDGYWSSEDGVEGAASHGTSRKSFNEIAEDIWEEMAET